MRRLVQRENVSFTPRRSGVRIPHRLRGLGVNGSTRAFQAFGTSSNLVATAPNDFEYILMASKDS